MFTDTVGSTAAMRSDEEGSLRRLREQEQLVRPLLEEYQGRAIKSTGDGFLVEFDSALKATQCAVELQRRLYERNLGSESDPIVVRIGVHLGDVEPRDGDIYGDAVNIAARMEPIAEAGGVCVSAQVYDQVRHRVPFQFESQGPKSLKGIREPVVVYRVRLPWLAVRAEGSTAENPRVAILPFTNMSPDPTDQYFADGLTEELIATVSKVRELNVISRTSVMQYKSQTKPVVEIGRELGVSRVLEGSVRKAGLRVRVTVQLIDAVGDQHLWAETYDRQLDDIFAVQSSIAEKVAAELGLRLVESEKRRLEKKPTESSEAYSLFLRGQQLLQEQTESSVRQALQCYERALELDPHFARGLVALADCHHHFGVWGIETYAEATAKTRLALQRAAQLDPDLPELHASLSVLHYSDDNGPAAEAEAKRAIELNPSLSRPYHILAEIAGIRGEADRMVELFETAYRLDPVNPTNVGAVRTAYFYTGRETQLLEFLRRTEVLFPRIAAASRTEYYLSGGDLERASEYYAQTKKLGDANRLWTDWIEGSMAALSGKREEALAIIRRIEAASMGPIALNSIAAIGLLLGDVDAYFANLERALEGHAIMALAVVYHPLIASARGDPRYASLIRELRRQTGLDLSTPSIG